MGGCAVSREGEQVERRVRAYSRGCSIVGSKWEKAHMPPDRRNRIQIEVTDYGPIAEAKVDLRPLTVLVGPSNTGKSYLAVLIYALHRFFSGASFEPDFAVRALTEPRVRSSPFYFTGSVGKRKEVGQVAQTLADWIREVKESPISRRRRKVLPEIISSIIRPYLQTDEVWNDVFPRELARCFGTTDAQWLIRHAKASVATIGITHIAKETLSGNPPLRFDFRLSRDGCIASSAVPAGIPLSAEDDYASALSRRVRLIPAWQLDQPEFQSRIARSLIRELAGWVGSTLVSPLSRPAHYLPADRTGIMHAHQVVVPSMMSAAPWAGLRQNVSLPNLSGVLSDFLLQLLSLGEADRNAGTKHRSSRGLTIETNMLSGSIRIDRSNPYYPSFPYRPNGWKEDLPLMNSSSMVSELAPVVLYLRHVVRQGEVLIIEEPESNLHPSMQVEFVRQLAVLVNSGIRVMLTTHSEWVLDELANLVRLSDIKTTKRPEALRAEPALDKRDVGVWLFKKEQGDGGSRVREIPLDTDEGGFASGYDETARLTYNQWATIQNLIEG